MSLPRDGGPGDEEEQEDDEDEAGPRDAVLVTDADTAMGALLVLQLVLGRVKIKVLVKDVARAKREFGPYVNAVQGDVMTGSALKAAMKGVRAVIVPGPTGQSLRAAAALGIEHVVLLASAVPSQGALGGLFGRGVDAVLAAPERIQEARAVPVPCTIIRFGRLRDQLGGTSYVEFTQGEEAAPGAIAREDAALVAVRALKFPPEPGTNLVFSAGGAGPGVPPARGEWVAMFERLEREEAAVAAAP